ncbi:hypothetical protein ES704_01041 [subsurface metagenome]
MENSHPIFLGLGGGLDSALSRSLQSNYILFIKLKIGGKRGMELKDISGNIVYGGKDDTMKLLETIAEAIIHGGISIDDVRIVSEEIRKGDIRTKNIAAMGEKWKKISFWYRLETKK